MRTTIAALLTAAALSVPVSFSAQALPPGAASVPAPSETTAALPIVGAWTLNHDLSSKPPTRDGGDGARPQGRTGGGRGRGGGAGGGGFGGGFGGNRGGRGSGQMSDGDRQKLIATMRRMREAPERLTITYDGKVVAFADGDGRTWKATTDGKKQTLLTGDGEIDIKAHLDGPRLVIEETVSGRARLIYTYAPVEDAGARRLSVQVKLEGGGSARAVPEMTRVYDAVAP